MAESGWRNLAAALTDHFVGDGTAVVDIGASWGLFSYHLARLVGRAGTVFSMPGRVRSQLLRGS